MPPGGTKTPLECIEAGYGPDLVHYKKDNGPYWTWIYVGACTGLKLLAETEDDPGLKARYLHGIAACAREAYPDILKYALLFDNNDTSTFGYVNWRAVYHEWLPQKTVPEAVQAAERADKGKTGTRFSHECATGRIPLALAGSRRRPRIRPIARRLKSRLAIMTTARSTPRFCWCMPSVPTT